MPSYVPAGEFKPPHADYLPPISPTPKLLPNHGPPKEGLNPVLLPNHGPPADTYLPPSKEYLPPPQYQSVTPKPTYQPPSQEYLPPHPSYKPNVEQHNLPTSYLPPQSEYLPPSGNHPKHPTYEPPSKEYLPPHPSYKPPSKDYIPPDIHHSSHQNKLQSYVPPHADYLPPHEVHHTDHHPRMLPSYSPPTKEYLPPKLPSYQPDHPSPPLAAYHEGAKAPPLPNSYLPPNSEYISPPDAHIKNSGTLYQPPSKDYLPPDHHEQIGSHYLPPSKEYLPPPKPTYHSKPHSDLTGYTAPSREYLPGNKPSYNLHREIHPPTSDYLPPDEFLPPPEFIPAIDDDEDLTILDPPHLEYLPPPSRGPQYQSNDKDSSGKGYVAPPPRNSSSLTAPDVINGHNDPTHADFTDIYIPPKTKNDVPKNFLRPEDIPELEDPDLIDIIDAELKDTIEQLGISGSFLGLAKLKDGTKKDGADDNSRWVYRY